MAPLREHRTHSRMSCRIPLEFMPWNSRRPFNAMIYNVSDDGAYIETSHPVDPGDNVLIHLARKMPDEVAGRIPRENAGMIRWAMPVHRGRSRLYGAGIRFYYPELMDEIEEGSGLNYFCDLCGRSLGLGEITQLQSIICMCPSCNDAVEKLPEALYKAASRYLIGNVL